METSSVSSSNAAGATASSDPTQGLGGDDFFKLLIAQLVNQDPLEPTSNQELLNQISSIRDIELSTNLSESLQTLTGQQKFASAASLIGQFVSGDSTGESGEAVSGVVESVRFDANGAAILELEDGRELPLSEVGSVMHGLSAAEALVGRFVTGVDQRDPADPTVVEGVVTAVKTSDTGRIVLELDTGEDVRLTDVLSAQTAEDAATTGG